MKSKLTRRQLLRYFGIGSAGMAVAACAPKVVEVEKVVTKEVEKIVKETVIVEGTPKVVEKVVKETVVVEKEAPTAAPVEVVEIVYWTSVGGLNLQGQEELVSDFNASQAAVKATCQHEPKMREKLLAAYAAGTPPNVTRSASGGYELLGYAHLGGIIPLDDFIERDFADQVADFYDYLWKNNFWKGHQWGIVEATNNLAWFYNEEMLAEAGVEAYTTNPTWDELTDILKAVTRDTNGDGEIDQWGYNPNPRGDRQFYDFVVQNGGRVANDDWTESRIDSPEVAETLKWLRDMVYEWKVCPVPYIAKAFESGLVAWEYQGSYRIPVYRELTDVKVGVMPTTKKVKPYSVNGGFSLVIWKSDDRTQQASWEFIKGMTSPESMLKWVLTIGLLPARKSVGESAAYQAILKQDPMRQIFVDELAYGGFWLRTPYGADFRAAIGDGLERVLLEDQDIEMVLREINETANKVLAGEV